MHAPPAYTRRAEMFKSTSGDCSQQTLGIEQDLQVDPAKGVGKVKNYRQERYMTTTFGAVQTQISIKIQHTKHRLTI